MHTYSPKFSYFYIHFFCAVKSEIVEPSCKLPLNYTGDWINTANLDADVVINSTHIVETWWPDEGRYRKTVYVCKEKRGSRYLMARLTVDGWYSFFVKIFKTP